MSGGGILFVAIGAASLVAGLAVLTAALRRHKREHPAGVAMLIGGMMGTAFDLLMAGFAIGYAMSAPAALDSRGAR